MKNNIIEYLMLKTNKQKKNKRNQLNMYNLKCILYI